MELVDTRVRKKRGPSRIALERRQNLIDAAIRDIARNGYEAVTVATICDEAGFSRGLIGHYFSGKDDLLLEAVKSITAELGAANRRAAEAAGTDPFARLHGVVKSSFTAPGFTPEKVAVWVALTGKARWSSQLGEIYRDLWRDYRAGIGRLFARAATQRNLEIDAEQVALGFSQLIEGMWVGWAADPMSVTPEKAALSCHAYVDMMLGEMPTKASILETEKR